MSALWLALFLAAAPTGHEHHAAAAEAEGADAPSTESIYNVTSPWTDAGEKRWVLKAFAGAPVVIAMIYTSCQAVCPMLVSDLQRVERDLPVALRGQVRFVLVSFDPARDTPKRLAQYAKERGLPAKWTLLTGSADDVRELAAVLGMRYRPTGKDFAHSNLITVLDSGGVVRHRLVGLRQDPAPAVAAVIAASHSQK